MQNKIIQLIRSDQWLQLMNYLLEDPMRVLNVHGSKIGWVLSRIKSNINESEVELLDRYYQLRREFTLNHPDNRFFRDNNSDNQWLELIHLRDWNALRDYLEMYPEHFWTKINDAKRFIILGKIRRYVYNILSKQSHSAEYSQFRSLLMSYSPE